MNFLPVLKPKDFKTVEALAFPIWREHYTPIIGAAQVEYMLQKFQAAKAIKKQVSEGYSYYLLEVPSAGPVGYLAVRPESGELYLDKFYFLKEYRGKGHAREALRFLEEMAKGQRLSRISLSVNKKNPAVKVYEALGFHIAGPVMTDIGNGYVMDDYRMVKQLHP